MFNKLIGQKEVKSQLGFYADLFNAGFVVPPIMLNAAKGLGKTAFATAFHEETKQTNRKFIEINCGTIRNAEQFFDQFFVPQVMGQEVTVLFDECHALPKDLTNIFLTAFNVEGAEKKLVSVAEGFMEFDFKKQVYLFATTELHKLFDPLKDRLTIIDFKQYDEKELGAMMKNKVDWVDYKDGVMDSIVSCVKGNARSAIKLSLKIQDWCNRHRISSMSHGEWSKMKAHFNILPFGLTNIEVQILRALHKRGACSLQMLSAITGMSRQAIQQEAENNLLRKGFMDIDGKRKITNKGTKILEQIK
jgi:Holliday junction resolvasome RuvABC ATP-dependent DNA helicase subunit